MSGNGRQLKIEQIANEIVSAANIVTCDGYYEIDIEAVAVIVDQIVPASTDPLAEKLAGHLATYDAVVKACPANQQRLGQRLCPKCSAGPDEGCRKEILACFEFVRLTREALAEYEASKS